MSKVVLIVEDDANSLDLLARVLTAEGDVAHRSTSVAARRAALAGGIDVIVLDWLPPDGEGAKLCAEFRQQGVQTPILLLTTEGEAAERIQGLRSGADDCLVKPFELEELLLRLDAIVRRTGTASHFCAGPFHIDLRTRQALLHGEPLSLTNKELDVLSCLAQNVGQVVSRSDLLKRVWNLSTDPVSAALDVHVSRLRDKLGANAWMVETVRGAGLRLRVDAPSSAQRESFSSAVGTRR